LNARRLEQGSPWIVRFVRAIHDARETMSAAKTDLLTRRAAMRQGLTGRSATAHADVQPRRFATWR
jgi:hypothetical protein